MSGFITHEILFTFMATLSFLVVGAYSYARHTNVHEKLEPRMVPWSLIAMACLATTFMLIVHLVNLFGFKTGR
ncbi:MAG: hypothetical protein V3U57_07750 [Robiginitomaculum sp.]